MPNVPPPESCEDEDVALSRLAAQDGLDQATKARLLRKVNERRHSPIAVRRIESHSKDEEWTIVYWMRAKNIPDSKREIAYQKCVLGYMSDVHFILTASRAIGLKAVGKNGKSGKDVIGMTSSLDHAVWFYSDDFDCGDWILYEMRSPQAGSGRGVVFGRMFTREGTLIAHVSQEGVVRARIHGPDDGNKQTSKL